MVIYLSAATQLENKVAILSTARINMFTSFWRLNCYLRLIEREGVVYLSRWGVEEGQYMYKINKF